MCPLYMKLSLQKLLCAYTRGQFVSAFQRAKLPCTFRCLSDALLWCRKKCFNTRNGKGCALKQCLFHVEISCTNWFFFDAEVRSNLPFLKRAEIVFLLVADTKSPLHSLSKDNYWFHLEIIPFFCTRAKKMLNFLWFRTQKSADLAFFKLCPINEKMKSRYRF